MLSSALIQNLLGGKMLVEASQQLLGTASNVGGEATATGAPELQDVHLSHHRPDASRCDSHQSEAPWLVSGKPAMLTKSGGHGLEELQTKVDMRAGGSLPFNLTPTIFGLMHPGVLDSAEEQSSETE